MCGICGIYKPNKNVDWHENPFSIISKMNKKLIHRGPDSDGIWASDDTTLLFGHRRLSIIDLSNLGAQPMTSNSGRYTITYNGEIYNFQSLKKELLEKGQTFRGHSDTEVITALLEEFGITECLKRLNGMFAIGIYDSKTCTLTLSRDRAGEKPLYYGKAGNHFVFSSEIKAIKSVHPNLKISKSAVELYFKYHYIPQPYSIYEGFNQLQSGHTLTIHPDLTVSHKRIEEPTQTFSETILSSPKEALCHLEELLEESVKIRMISDVPVGCFLSGGIDSSIIAAMMCRVSNRPVSTFSIGFENPDFDESKYAHSIAQYLGTKHYEHILKPEDCWNLIPSMSSIYDEPFADASQIPTTLLAKFARNHVSVCLTGDAGDELFHGYTRYVWCQNWTRMRRIPKPIRKQTLASIAYISRPPFSRAFLPIARLLSSNLTEKNLYRVLHKFKNFTNVETPQALYEYLATQWDTNELLTFSNKTTNQFQETTQRNNNENALEYFAARDFSDYLPNDILTKVDRASMASSLETRIPLLDPKIVTFANQLDNSLKLRGKETKWLLKELAYKQVPRTLLERPKKGFSIPLASWLRGPLKDWCESLLCQSSINQSGLLEYSVIQRHWNYLKEGNDQQHQKIWSVLMFQSWYMTQRISS